METICDGCGTPVPLQPGEIRRLPTAIDAFTRLACGYVEVELIYCAACSARRKASEG